MTSDDSHIIADYLHVGITFNIYSASREMDSYIFIEEITNQI